MFGKCDMCVKYKEILKSMFSAESQDYWCRMYSLHLLSQYRDRECYYHERDRSRRTAEQKLAGSESTVTIIIDAMDQGKFSVPRHLPGAKMLKDCLRPKLHVVGIIVQMLNDLYRVCVLLKHLASD